MQDAIRNYLLCQLIAKLDPMFNCDPQAITKAAACWRCADGMQAEVTNYLLCRLTVTLGDTIITYGNQDPDTPGGDINIFYVNIKPGCQSLWFWRAATQVWFQMNGEDMTGIYTASTFADMLQIPTVDCPPIRCRTLGNLAPGDAQASEYWFNPDSTDADDGVSIGLPADRDPADAGRWQQLPLG
jgi:hypothetical protein